MSDQTPSAAISADHLADAAYRAEKHFTKLLDAQRVTFIADMLKQRVGPLWKRRFFTQEEAELSWDRNVWLYDNEDHRRHAVRLLKIARTDHLYDIRLTQADILFLRQWLNAAADA